MTPKVPGIFRIAKYITFILIIGFVVFLFLFTSGSSRSFEEVSSKLEDSLDKETLVQKDAAAFKRNFRLNAADYDGVLYYSAGGNMTVEEVLLVKVKNEKQIQEVTAAIEERIESRTNDFEGYAPDAVKLLRDASQSVRGTYIFFACSPDADRYLSAFSSSL